MDWNFKRSSWGTTGLEQNIVPNVDEDHGKDKQFRASGDFSIDLKLGAVGNSHQKCEPIFGKCNTSPSGSMKRCRSSSNGSASVFCLVDGCNSDLSNCREYHRRHKVCETHSKTAEVTIRGQKQRFCQQCSRFHALEEFDEGKRSCRKRLDGHNKRRRKPQTDPICRSGSFLSGFRGPQLIQFSGSYVHPAGGAMRPAWPSISCSESNSGQFNPHQAQSHNLFLGSSPASISFKEAKPFPFMRSNDSALNCQPLLRSIQLSDFDRIAAGGVPDSDCALSLLSSTQMQTTSTAPGIHLVTLHEPGALSSMDDSVLVPNGNGRDSTMASPMIYPMQSGGSSCYKNNTQSFPFHWD